MENSRTPRCWAQQVNIGSLYFRKTGGNETLFVDVILAFYFVFPSESGSERNLRLRESGVGEKTLENQQGFYILFIIIFFRFARVLWEKAERKFY